jgi:hypothetical protein
MARFLRRGLRRKGERRTGERKCEFDSEATMAQRKRTVLRREFAVGSELVQ